MTEQGKHDFSALVLHILERSEANNFSVALSEWEPEGRIWLSPDYCPCGVRIREHCYIRNRVTGRKTYVGNKCIKRFLQLDFTQVFDGLKAITEDITAKPTRALVEHARTFGWITPGEAISLRSQLRPRHTPFDPSNPVGAHCIALNERILNRCVAAPSEEI